MARFVWIGVWLFLFRPSPAPLHGWRVFLLRLFGARMGPGCTVHASVTIWAPWNLVCEDKVVITPHVEIYNPSTVTLQSHVMISQYAYLCCATHAVHEYDFTLVCKPIRIGTLAWVAARSTVLPGVTLGEGAVLALGGVATRDIPDWEIHGGVPAKHIAHRTHTSAPIAPST